VNSLVELVTSNIDSVFGTDVHPSSSSPPGLVDGVNAPEMIVKVSLSGVIGRCIRGIVLWQTC
jgi:hypothetical protein